MLDAVDCVVKISNKRLGDDAKLNHIIQTLLRGADVDPLDIEYILTFYPKNTQEVRDAFERTKK